MGAHLIDGEFQSDKYPTTPRGKVPLSVRDMTAQDLLWEYAQRRRAVDAEFEDDLETALRAAGYVGQQLAHERTIQHALVAAESTDVETLRVQVEQLKRSRLVFELETKNAESRAGWCFFEMKEAQAALATRGEEIDRLETARSIDFAEIARLRKDVESMRARKDAVYEERNRLVALFASMSIAMGWRAGIGTHEDKPGEDWDPEWKTLLVIETPEGQASWHFHDSQRHLVEHLPLFDAKWDGHDTPTKYERMNRLSRQLLLSNKLVARDAEIEHLREELREQSLTLEDAVARLDRVTENTKLTRCPNCDRTLVGMLHEEAPWCICCLKAKHVGYSQARVDTAAKYVELLRDVLKFLDVIPWHSYGALLRDRIVRAIDLGVCNNENKPE